MCVNNTYHRNFRNQVSGLSHPGFLYENFPWVLVRVESGVRGVVDAWCGEGGVVLGDGVDAMCWG